MFSNNNKNLLFVALFILLIIFLYLITSYNQKLKEENKIIQSFNVKTLQLDLWLAEKKRLIENLTRSLELVEYSKERHLQFMQKTNKIMGTNSVFSGFENGLYFDTQGYWIQDFDPRTRPWYIETIKGKETTISGPMYYNDISGQKITWWSVSAPFFKDGKAFGVISSEILPQMIREHLKKIFTSQFEDILLFHKKTGVIISSVQKDKETQLMQNIFTKDIFDKFSKSKKASLKFKNVNTDEIAYLFNLSEAPWVLCGIRKE